MTGNVCGPKGVASVNRSCASSPNRLARASERMTPFSSTVLRKVEEESPDKNRYRLH